MVLHPRRRRPRLTLPLTLTPRRHQKKSNGKEYRTRL